MSYLDISNLYKDQSILMFKRAFALEKIHGTSAHISFKRTRQMVFGALVVDGKVVENKMTEAEWQKVWPDEIKVNFFSGGEKHENFIKLFNEQSLSDKFREMGVPEMVIFGEAYGGKCQGMSKSYGKDLKFIAFEVKIEHNWLAVPQAEQICNQFGLEFVHYEEVATDLVILNTLSEADSVQAVRNGMGPGHIREGVVLRPLIELRKNNGERIIAKHKNDKFQETTKKREVSKERLEVLTEANAIADDWVTEMRLSHVLQGFQELVDVTKTGDVIQAMIADILKESEGEIVDSKEARTAISKRTAMLFKQRLKNSIFPAI